MRDGGTRSTLDHKFLSLIQLERLLWETRNHCESVCQHLNEANVLSLLFDLHDNFELWS